MDRELKRGTLEMVLLQLLSERAMYGYEITSAIEQRSAGAFGVSDGTLYPVLYRLEKSRFVEPYWETPDRGVPRKYYRITADGSDELSRLRREWESFAGAIARLIQPGENR